jgi:single-strand DNA-binding protein
MSNFNFNKVILGGRLTADVELKGTPSGVSVCSFSLAVNRKYSKDSEAQTDFINCVAWRNTAEFISKYFKKGSSMCICGSMQVRNWTDNNGQKRYATEVIVDEAMFVDSKTEGEQGATTYAEALSAITPKAEMTELSDSDDLPF